MMISNILSRCVKKEIKKLRLNLFKKNITYDLKNKNKTNTTEVSLNSSFVEAGRSEVTKTLVFLHGLFGNSNNWRSIII